MKHVNKSEWGDQVMLMDGWGGFAFPGPDYFKIPGKGQDGFTGCYSCPATALAALYSKAENQKLGREVTQELVDNFQATLRRQKGQEKVKYEISAAPNPKVRREFGGSKTLDEYLAEFDYYNQVKIFVQSIPPHALQATFAHDSPAQAPPPQAPSLTSPSPNLPPVVSSSSSAQATVPPSPEKFESFEYDSDPEHKPNSPKRWRVNHLGANPRADEPAESMRVMPRCISSCLEFFKEIYPGEYAVVVYMNPDDSKSFAVGLPADVQGKGNKRAAECLGRKVTVWGDVKLFHKNQMRMFGRKKASPPSKKRQREEAQAPAPQAAPALRAKEVLLPPDPFPDSDEHTGNTPEPL
jgi:hypothetical protein